MAHIVVAGAAAKLLYRQNVTMLGDKGDNVQGQIPAVGHVDVLVAPVCRGSIGGGDIPRGALGGLQLHQDGQIAPLHRGEGDGHHLLVPVGHEVASPLHPVFGGQHQFGIIPARELVVPCGALDDLNLSRFTGGQSPLLLLQFKALLDAPLKGPMIDPLACQFGLQLYRHLGPVGDRDGLDNGVLHLHRAEVHALPVQLHGLLTAHIAVIDYFKVVGQGVVAPLEDGLVVPVSAHRLVGSGKEEVQLSVIHPGRETGTLPVSGVQGHIHTGRGAGLQLQSVGADGDHQIFADTVPALPGHSDVKAVAAFGKEIVDIP